jgi:glucose dehydrogenase
MAGFSAIGILTARKAFGTASGVAARAAVLATTMLATAAPGLAPVMAADVTPERLLNPDREPHNWLMNHRTYDGQRFSPLARISKGNVKNLKLAYAVPLGGTAGDEWIEATPLVENGFIYITDSWGVLYKIDGTSGEAGRIVWRMDPKQEKQANNRGAALWGNLVISAANWPARIVATDKETGKVVWETNMSFDTPELRITIRWTGIMGRSSAPSLTRTSTGLAASTRRPASPSNTTPARTSRHTRALAISRRASRSNGCARQFSAATTIGPARTIPGPSSSISRQ